MRRLLTATVFLLFATTTNAVSFYDGNWLVRELKNPSAENVGYIMATGYIAAVFDSSESVRKTTEWNLNNWNFNNTPGSVNREQLVRFSNLMHGCPSPNVTLAQLVAVVDRWLREHPNRWHEIGTSLVGAAFIEAFPCNYK